ncbi:hypothetical protein ACN47E_008179 [Coniothyrium glycines]
MNTSRYPWITGVISATILITTVPFAIAAIALEAAWVPDIILASKVINTGPGQTTTLEFNLLTSPNDAVLAASYMSLVLSIFFVIILICVRHFATGRLWNWFVLTPAVVNLLTQIGCCAAAYIFKSKYPTANSVNQVRYIDGKYDSDGHLYTKEGWACTMNTFYAEQEGEWANKACENFGTARALTIPFVLGAAYMLSVAWWQVRNNAGQRQHIARQSKKINKEGFEESGDEYINMDD